MIYIALILAWLIAAFFYSKSKNQTYLKSFIKLPFVLIWILFKYLISELANPNGELGKSKTKELERKLKKSGVDSEKIQEFVEKRENSYESFKSLDERINKK